jgi:hypothetical protein
MRDIIGPILSSVVVLYVLTVLLSADRTPSGFDFRNNQEKISDLGSQLIQIVMLQRRQQSSDDRRSIPTADRTMRVQQALKDNGFYSGPVDGVMREKTQEAIQSFQESRRLKVTGTIDEETVRELGIS